MNWPIIASSHTAPPPEWALWERHLIATMNEAALAYQERYTRARRQFCLARELARLRRLGRWL